MDNKQGNIKKTGIFGGAFDPVHNGHIHLAREAIEQLNLRRLIVIPTYESPHKGRKLADFDKRFEICKAAFKELEGCGHCSCTVEVSDIERKLGGVSYTINTLRELKKIYPDDRFYLLIGGDMMYSFTEWHRYEAILKESTVCAVARGGDNLTEMIEYANEIGHIKVLPTDVVDISSTQIREMAAAGEEFSDSVPASALDMIKALYGSDRGVQ